MKDIVLAAVFFMMGLSVNTAYSIDFEEVQHSGNFEDCWDFVLFNVGNSAYGMCRLTSASPGAKVKIFDFSNPTNPAFVTELTTLPDVYSSPYFEHGSGYSRVYFLTRDRASNGRAVGNTFLAAFDITHPESPLKLFEVDLGAVLQKTIGGREYNWGSIVALNGQAFFALYLGSPTEKFRLSKVALNGSMQSVYEKDIPLRTLGSYGAGNTLHLLLSDTRYQKTDLNSVLYTLVSVSAHGNVSSYDVKDTATRMDKRCTRPFSLGTTFGFSKKTGAVVVGGFCTNDNWENRFFLSSFESEPPTTAEKIAKGEFLYSLDVVTPTGKFLGHGYNTQSFLNLNAPQLSLSSRILISSSVQAIDLGNGSYLKFSTGFRKLGGSGAASYQHQADVNGPTGYITLNLEPANVFAGSLDYQEGHCRLSHNEYLFGALVETYYNGSFYKKRRFFKVRL